MTMPFILTREQRHAALQIDRQAAQEAYDAAVRRKDTQGISKAHDELMAATTCLLRFENLSRAAAKGGA
ncbi:hypothetical protein [Celeribacter naphthalenivorans]|uniref:hypothetical protein n=1 Tax=Celeribacter naphthalenivorans TaxID=1614694 RepID=UPI001CFAF801|nr:hypothetical protein [Celeribacter naphthalenivorans]